MQIHSHDTVEQAEGHHKQQHKIAVHKSSLPSGRVCSSLPQLRLNSGKLWHISTRYELASKILIKAHCLMYIIICFSMICAQRMALKLQCPAM